MNATDEQLARARALYADGSDDNIEIDDNALTSRGEGGVWVLAWVWVADKSLDDLLEERQALTVDYHRLASSQYATAAERLEAWKALQRCDKAIEAAGGQL